MEQAHRAGYAGTATSTAPVPMRPGTPDTAGRNPYEDTISPAATGRVNPFSTPFTSRPASSFGSSSAVNRPDVIPNRYFHSRRVRKGEIEKPWKDKKDPKEKWVTIIPLIGLVVGLAIAGFLVYDGISSVVTHTYCPVLSDDFSGGLNKKVWTQEAEVGGYGSVKVSRLTIHKEKPNLLLVTVNSKRLPRPTKMFSFKMASLSSGLRSKMPR